MATTTDYINQLKSDKQTLVDNLVAKGVTATSDETFTSLVPKVATISGYEPTGELAITENGTYDVTNYASANVNVPTKTLGTKTITANGTYLAIDDNLDGYSEVEVATSGVDINDYFKSESIDNNPTSVGCWYKFIKKIPKLNLNITNNCANMFYYCKAEEIDVSEFNTSNVTNMYQMFYDCNALTSLYLSNFNTSNVKSMNSMFYGCSSLTSLDLSSFNTSNVTNMQSMFYYCKSLTDLDLSSFNTSNVTDMSYMFNYCRALTTTINIMSTGVTSYGNMFNNAATNSGAKITVNYIANASSLVDSMIATKSASSNVVKGSVIS